MVSRIDAGAVGPGHQRHQLRLQVGGEARVGLRLHRDRLQRAAVACDAHAALRLGDGDAGALQRAEGGLQEALARALQLHLAAGRGHGERIGAGLDAVGQHRVHGAFEPVGALDARASLPPTPSILAPILTRHSATSPISGSRAAFSITVSPLRQRRRHQHGVGGAHRDLGEGHPGTLEAARRPGHHVAAVDVDLGAERLEPHQVQVDRPGADGTAARHGDARLSAARQQRAQHPEARAHAAHQLVGGGGVDDVAGRQMERLAQMRRRVAALAVDGQVDAVIAQDAPQQRHVREARHVLQGEPVGGEEARDHQRQGRVLRARRWRSCR